MPPRRTLTADQPKLDRINRDRAQALADAQKNLNQCKTNYRNAIRLANEIAADERKAVIIGRTNAEEASLSAAFKKQRETAKAARKQERTCAAELSRARKAAAKAARDARNQVRAARAARRGR